MDAVATAGAAPEPGRQGDGAVVIAAEHDGDDGYPRDRSSFIPSRCDRSNDDSLARDTALAAQQRHAAAD